MEFKAQNTNQLAPIVYKAMLTHGFEDNSRNGPVLRLPGTIITKLTAPNERVHFDPVRNCNPFFHLMEAMAMLTDTNDGPFLAFFAKNMLSFLDEGENRFNAFYGTRMHRGNQFWHAIGQIIRDNGTRRAYVDLWDIGDINKTTKDMACNLGMLFEVVGGFLDMTTFNRSNDAVLGCVSGANIVHFSFFHEFVALATGVPQGIWTHVSANTHVYTQLYPHWTKLYPHWTKLCANYALQDWKAAWDYGKDTTWLPMFDAGLDNARAFLLELHSFVGMCVVLSRQSDTLSSFMDLTWKHKFIDQVLKPMMTCWTMRKCGMPAFQEPLALMPPGNDWYVAAQMWLQNHPVKTS